MMSGESAALDIANLYTEHGPWLRNWLRARTRCPDRASDLVQAEDSPQYRPVAVAASLCRVQLRLHEGEDAAALDELKLLKSWAEQRGAGRLLIDVNILLASCFRSMGAAAQAKAAFDEAVGIAMFQNLSRPFVDARHFVQPLLEEALAFGTSIDRFRDQFLKALSRSMPTARSNGASHSVLSEAESDVLYYLSLGHSNKEIARIIGMSPDTVKYRLKAVFRKIGVSKRRDAVRISAERGLIPSVTAPEPPAHG